MYISKDSLIINGINMGKYILEATYGFYDTWSSDTGFNTLSGKFSGTFKGTYPKITIKFAKSLSIDDLKMLTTKIFRTTTQTIASTSTEEEIPSAKAVYDYVNSTVITVLNTEV